MGLLTLALNVSCAPARGVSELQQARQPGELTVAVTEFGVAASWAEVEVSGSDGRIVFRGETDGDGRCSIQVPSFTVLTVRVWRDVGMSRSASRGYRIKHAIVLGEVVELTDTIVLDANESQVWLGELPSTSGAKYIVRDQNGSAIPGVTLRVVGRDQYRPYEYVPPFAMKLPSVISAGKSGVIIVYGTDLDWLVAPEAPARNNRNYDAAPFAIPLSGAVGQELVCYCGLFISGTVSYADGRYVANAVVKSGTIIAWTDREGAYSLGPLIPGSYALTATSTQSGESADGVASAGDNDVHFVLD